MLQHGGAWPLSAVTSAHQRGGRDPASSSGKLGGVLLGLTFDCLS